MAQYDIKCDEKTILIRMEKVKEWLEGKHDGRRGLTATAYWVKWYLLYTRGEKCEECGWCKINQHTGNVPIELEHIDGNFTNNNIDNLKLLCPNCHSLTKTYKGANKEGRPRSQYASRKKVSDRHGRGHCLENS